MFHERRGNFETSSQPFERTGSISAGMHGSNVDIANALARLQALDVQDPHGQMHPSVQRGQFASESTQHCAPNQFAGSHLDVVESHWPEHNRQLSNGFIESHLNQLHLEAEKQKRNMKANLSGRDPNSRATLVATDEISNRGLADLFHHNMILQSSQSLELGDPASTSYENRDASWPFSRAASDHSFNFSADKFGLANSFRDTSLYNQGQGQQDHFNANLERCESAGRLGSRSSSAVVLESNQLLSDVDEIGKKYFVDSLGGDTSSDRVLPSDVMEGKTVKKRGSKVKLSRSVLDVTESGIEQTANSVIDNGDLEFNAPTRHASFGSSSGGSTFYNHATGVDNAYSADLSNHKVPGILSRGTAAISLKVSSQVSGGEHDSVPSIRGKNTSSFVSSEVRREPAENSPEVTPSSKEIRLHRTSSITDGPEASSFIDMLKSTKKMAPTEPEEPHDASKASSIKKKGKKGRQIDPSLLGFKIHSNRILMGEIQRPDE
ncbi:uncharacterized protein A4U43_C10F4620 [Asparagus officinalis]|uniref:Uncharacterized protein n=1 Tax=Asparagus officinalis TaxID=4686 RepID=A0A5P1E3S7_ASPOF|nr:uncharacterized protein A4U43_C10F4620 [Asparagus officinalis]